MKGEEGDEDDENGEDDIGEADEVIKNMCAQKLGLYPNSFLRLQSKLKLACLFIYVYSLNALDSNRHT